MPSLLAAALLIAAAAVLLCATATYYLRKFRAAVAELDRIWTEVSTHRPLTAPPVSKTIEILPSRYLHDRTAAHPVSPSPLVRSNLRTHAGS